MAEWFSVTRASVEDEGDEVSPQDAAPYSGAPTASDRLPVPDHQRHDLAQRRARYSTRWPAGAPSQDAGDEPDEESLATSSVNRWVMLVSLGVLLFIAAALVTGMVIGRIIRAPNAVRIAEAVPVRSTLSTVSQSWTSPGSARLDPRPVSDVRESEVSALFDTGPTAGDPAPAFQLEALGGQALSLADLKGSVVVVNFWATWCTWCRYELPALQAVYDKYKDQGLVVVGVDVEEPNQLVEAYVRRYGLTFPVVLDMEGATAEAYKVRGLPMTFFVDREGSIVRVKRGAMREDELELFVRDALASD